MKEEMERTTAKNIADHLYQHQDKLLSGPAHESIHASRTRPDTVEKLLKRVDALKCIKLYLNKLRKSGII